jgi:probable HAF family extracellular repeat protein
MMRLRLSLVVALAAVAGFVVPLSAQQYSITNLGSLGGSWVSTYPSAINNSGQVAGTARQANFSLSTPFRTEANSPINPLTDNLGFLTSVGATAGSASSINNSGQVAGTASIPIAGSPGYFYSIAFRADPGNSTLVSLGTRTISGYLGANSTNANGINSSGQVTGSADTEEAPGACSGTVGIQAFLTAADGTVSTSEDLGTVEVGNCGTSVGLAVNTSGQVVGYSGVAGYSFLPTHAFLATPGEAIQDLGTLGGLYTVANAVNDAGQVVGNSDFDPTMLFHPHAFLATATTAMQNLGTLGGTWVYANSINNAGQIVGTSTLSGDTQTDAYIYQNGTMTDLNTLIPAGSGWVLQNVVGINDAGQIVGNGTYNGAQAAFRLDPPLNVGVSNLITEVSTLNLGLSTTEVRVLSATLDVALAAAQRINQGASGPGGEAGVNLAKLIARADLEVFIAELHALANNGTLNAASAASLMSVANNLISAL